MALADTLDTIYLCWMCKPKSHRELFRMIKRRRVHSIVELGVHSIERTLRLIRMARRSSPGQEIHYAGVDLFDARPVDQPRLTLKQTHRSLAGHGATIRLIPGDVSSALARYANQLRDTQLLLVSAQHDPQQLAHAWRYVPRMLANDAVILQAVGDTEDRLERVTHQVIDARAAAAERERRAA